MSEWLQVLVPFAYGAPWIAVILFLLAEKEPDDQIDDEQE